MTGPSQFRRELRTSHWPRAIAELSASGLTPSTMAGPGWRRTSRGFYVPSQPGAVGTQRPTPTQRLLDAVPLIPATGALTGWAAAFVSGVDLLDGLDGRTMAPLPVPVCCGRDLGRRSSRQVRFLRDRLPDSQVRQVAGIPVAIALRTAFDGARMAPDLGEAVAFIDACAHAGLVDVAEVGAFAAGHSRWKGLRQATRAIGLADAAARSPGESRLRVCYVTEAGLPRPEVNLPVFDLAGRLLGIGDLLDIGAGFVSEYDGGDHRERRRHHDDNIREERFESAGLVVVRADSEDLRGDRVDLVRRLRDGYERGRRRDRGRDAWTTTEPEWWHEHLDPAAMLTPGEWADLDPA